MLWFRRSSDCWHVFRTPGSWESLSQLRPSPPNLIHNVGAEYWVLGPEIVKFRVGICNSRLRIANNVLSHQIIMVMFMKLVLVSWLKGCYLYTSLQIFSLLKIWIICTCIYVLLFIPQNKIRTVEIHKNFSNFFSLNVILNHTRQIFSFKTTPNDNTYSIFAVDDNSMCVLCNFSVIYIPYLRIVQQPNSCSPPQSFWNPLVPSVNISGDFLYIIGPNHSKY